MKKMFAARPSSLERVTESSSSARATKKLPVITGITTMEFDSDFEEAVFDSLQKEGLDLVPQVGTSGYRIDLAVKHPDKPGEYILGIECDGAKYHSSRYARDRDKVRQEVLESLGWTIHRIWSDDWITDKKGEIEKIKAKLNNLLLGAPVWVKSEKVFEEVQEESGISEFDPKKMYPAYETTKTPKVKLSLEFDSYGTLKRFSNRTKIYTVMENILKTESPMTKNLLFKRTNEKIGLGRMGSRIQRLYDSIIRNMVSSKKAFNRGDTISNIKIKTLAPIRISNESVRSFMTIPIEELAHASKLYLENSGAISEEHLSKDVARLFYDNTRSGKKIMTRMKKVIKYLETNKLIERTQGKIIAKK